MIEASENKDIAVTENATVEQETEKKYTFRKLGAPDMFLMFRIIGNIGIDKFKACFEGEALEKVMALFKQGDEKALTAVGLTISFDIVNIIVSNLPKCEKEIYQLLSQVSGMPEMFFKNDMILFTEMVIDFIKKEEFPAFIKVVSKLFK